VLVALMMGGLGKQKPDTMTDYSKSEKQTTYGQAMDAAQAVTCQNNLAQARNAINMYLQSGETPPADIKGLNLPDSCTKCAVSGEPYVYDPQAGRISCPTHTGF
jgi:hypothetical protein